MAGKAALSDAPYGVIFDGERAFVGAGHLKPIILSYEFKERVQNLAQKHGVWYEGDGKDIGPNTSIFGPKSSYRGSWDDALQKTIKGYPTEFLSVLFSNVEVNKQKKSYLDPVATIFDSILKRHDKNYFSDDRKIPAPVLTEFLREGSEKGHDFIAMSRKRATKENLDAFFDAGERLMWPRNWQDYPNKLGKLAKKFNDARVGFLLRQKRGVYVVGAGHMLTLKQLDKSLRLQGGEKASE